MTTPIPTQVTIQAALRMFILAIVPAGVEVIEGQDSRVPEPQGTDFVVMTPILRKRLETDLIAYADVAFNGSISGTVLTVSSVEFGTIPVPGPLFGVGVAAGSQIIPGGGGTGGPGTYFVAPGQAVASGAMAAGQAFLVAPTELVYQLDFHSANLTDAADMVQSVMTMFRSEYAMDAFDAAGLGPAPLYADDPRQAPFINAEKQWESRWTLDAHLQTNQAVPWPQQFMDQIQIIIKPPADAFV